MRRRLFCFLLVASCGALPGASSVRGSVLVGPSSLLTQGDADQLEAWLGEGTISLTRIFAKQSGDDAADFHAAADGKGRTFTVMQVLSNSTIEFYSGQPFDNPEQIIGGYNPQSWNSTAGMHYTPMNADRTAFLFNLTTDEIQRQSLTTETGSNGQFQTYNIAGTGPTFGIGHDIYVQNDLTFGYTYNNSYGGTAASNDIFSGTGNFHWGDMFGAIEVFSIAAAPDGSVAPEPVSALVWGGLGVAAGLAVRRTSRPA